ncbi:hypothetical protein OXX80_000794 [Metschnikowia pulcherrima]
MNQSPDGSDISSRPPHRLVTLRSSFHLDFSVRSDVHSSSIKPVSLSDIQDVSTQQALVIKDMLFALLGYEGHYVRHSERYSGDSLRDRIRGPDFKVAAPLDISLKTVTKKLLRYGKYYSGLRHFAQIYNMSHFGRVNQRLCCEIRRCLAQFRRLVLSFEHQFEHSDHFSLSVMDNEIQNSCGDRIRHLYEITCAIHAETEQRNLRFETSTSVSSAISGDSAGRDPRFDTFLDSVRTDISLGTNVSSDPNQFDVCKGGLVLQIVETRIAQFEGDMKAGKFLFDLFEAISLDYVASLNLWLAEGEVDDQFQEFLVKKNDLPKSIFYANVERYWDELYVVKTDGLISQFSGKDVQAKVLATGKYLNIFKRCIGTASLHDFPDKISTVPCPETITSLCAQDLHLKIFQFYDRANNLLLKLLFRGYHFKELLTCIHESYLLSDSSKTDSFLDITLHELGKSKTSVSTVTLIDTFNGIFSLGSENRSAPKTPESASTHTSVANLLKTFQKFSIDTKSFYELSEEIISTRTFDAQTDFTGDEQASRAIRRLVSQSLKQQQVSSASDQSSEASDKDHVVAAVNIDCELPFPLNLIVCEKHVFEYQLIFKLQMILRYVSKTADHARRDIMHSSVWNYKHFPSPVSKLVLRLRVLMFRMKSFVTELQNYLDHIVIDANFSSLKDVIEKISSSIDKPRPASRAARSSSPHKDIQPLAKHANKNNSIFDEKIKFVANRQASAANFARDTNYDDIQGLGRSLETYLGNILRDSMITNTQLLEQLRHTLNLVSGFAKMTGRLKKTFISTEDALFQAFARDYPGQFENIVVNEETVRQRTMGLNNVITKFWTDFNSSLRSLSDGLKQASTETAAFTALTEKLAVL